jgi:hypothetical protein
MSDPKEDGPEDIGKYARTASGDRFLVLLLTDPEHPDVQDWLRELREDSASSEEFTDQELIDYTVRLLTSTASKELL